MRENNFVFIFFCCYFVYVHNAHVRDFSSNTTGSNHTNRTRTEEEHRPKKDLKEIIRADHDISNFTNHLSKKYHSIFETLRDKAVETKTKEEIDFLARNYNHKFQEFVNKTENQNINTKSARRNAMLQTFDSANVILRNLVNHLQDNLEGNSNEDEISADLVKNMAVKLVDKEKDVICEKFNICRESQTFADFMLEVLVITSELNFSKLKLTMNTVQAIAKKKGTGPLRDPLTKKRFIAALKRDDHPYWLNIMFKTMKNIIEHKKQPLAALGPEPYDLVVAKTRALVEVLDAMEQASPPTKENKDLWKDIETSFKAWAEEKRKVSDIENIMQKLMNHLYEAANRSYADENDVVKLENIINIFIK